MRPDVQEEFDLIRFENLLATSTGEQEVTAFLRKYPRALYWTFCSPGGHDCYAFGEFPLGSQYKTDFILLNSYSGAWEAYFIELEPVDDPVFTKNRTPTKRVTTAIRQVDDWRDYVSRNLDYLRSEFVRWAKSRDLLAYSSGLEPSNYSGDKLADPQTVILTNFIIIVGRSSRLTKEQRSLVGRVSNGHGCSIVTYDRILHLARNRYGSSDDPNRWLQPSPE